MRRDSRSRKEASETPHSSASDGGGVAGFDCLTAADWASGAAVDEPAAADRSANLGGWKRGYSDSPDLGSGCGLFHCGSGSRGRWSHDPLDTQPCGGCDFCCACAGHTPSQGFCGMGGTCAAGGLGAVGRTCAAGDTGAGAAGDT